MCSSTTLVGTPVHLHIHAVPFISATYVAAAKCKYKLSALVNAYGCKLKKKTNQCFINLQQSSFGEPVHSVALVSCSWLTGVE